MRQQSFNWLERVARENMSVQEIVHFFRGVYSTWYSAVCTY